MCTYQATMSIYISYELTAINSVTRSPGIHIFTMLTYVPEPIFLPYCICMFHCTTTIVYIQTPHYCTYQFQNNKLQHLFTKLMPFMCQEQNMHLKCQIYIIYTNYLASINDGRCQYIYTRYELPVISPCDKKHCTQMTTVTLMTKMTTVQLQMPSCPIRSNKPITTMMHCIPNQSRYKSNLSPKPK